MADFYTEMQEVASELLIEFGAPAIVTKKDTTVTVPGEPWNNQSAGSPRTDNTFAAAVPVSDLDDKKLLDTVGAYKDSANVLVSAKELTLEVIPGDVVSVGGKDWKLIKATPIRPATTTVMYNCVGYI